MYGKPESALPASPVPPCLPRTVMRSVWTRLAGSVTSWTWGTTRTRARPKRRWSTCCAFWAWRARRCRLSGTTDGEATREWEGVGVNGSRYDIGKWIMCFCFLCFRAIVVVVVAFSPMFPSVACEYLCGSQLYAFGALGCVCVC